ncbi:serine O-acetyltransferase, partial [mine drainage metagenome]
MNYFLTGADIHPGADIGGGLRITHTSGLVIGKGVVIGQDVNILHGVTLGGSAKDRFGTAFSDGYPLVGDRTEIWAGAKVLGPVQVGNDCQIGANAVLVHDLPDGAVYTPGREVASLRQEVADLTQKVADLTQEVASLRSPFDNDTQER